jgi:hypothetical protein
VIACSVRDNAFESRKTPFRKVTRCFALPPNDCHFGWSQNPCTLSTRANRFRHSLRRALQFVQLAFDRDVDQIIHCLREHQVRGQRYKDQQEHHRNSADQAIRDEQASADSPKQPLHQGPQQSKKGGSRKQQNADYENQYGQAAPNERMAAKPCEYPIRQECGEDEEQGLLKAT